MTLKCYQKGKYLIKENHFGLLALSGDHYDSNSNKGNHHSASLNVIGTTRYSSERLERWLEKRDGQSNEDGLQHCPLLLLVLELYQLWMGL